jgi:hypothetical protein
MFHLFSYRKRIDSIIVFITDIMNPGKRISIKLFIFSISILGKHEAFSQQIKVGAYYFDGWNGQYREKLMTQFLEREPIWGWRTSTPEIVDAQIIEAANHGISFFSFCWYFKPNADRTVLDDTNYNNALKLFLESKHKSKLKFSLMISNDQGYRIWPKDWNELCVHWCNLFKDPSYLQVNERPLIAFFDIYSLLSIFQTTEAVENALAQLRDMAIKNGLKGVTVAANASTAEGAALAQKLGFDIVTGYNYHGYGLWTKENLEVVSIEQMLVEKTLWKTLATVSQKPVIPVITLNWDRRPLDTPATVRSPRFSGYSPLSVAAAISSCKKWMAENKHLITKENIVVMYAWNEYGEGAWLTPTKNGTNLLEGVKRAMIDQIPSTTGP